MLPAPPKKLFGREKDLEILQNAFSFNNAIYIFGQGGIGKTALVSKLLYIIYQKNFSEIFYINIPHHSDFGSFIDLLISKFLAHHAIDISLSQTMSQDEKLDYFVELLHQKSIPICIDNLHHIDSASSKIFIEKVLAHLFDSNVIFISRSPLPILDPSVLTPFTYQLEGISFESAYHQLSAYQVNHLFQHISQEKLQKCISGNPLFIQQLIAFAQRNKNINQAIEQTSESFIEYLISGLTPQAKEIIHALSFFQFAVPFSAFATKDEHDVVNQLVQFNIISIDSDKHFFLHDLLNENIKLCFKEKPSKERIQLFLSYCIKRLDKKISIEIIHETINFLLPIFDYQYHLEELQVLLKNIIVHSIHYEYPIDILHLYQGYVSHCAIDRDLSISVGIYLFETDQPDKALWIFDELDRNQLFDSTVIDNSNNNLSYNDRVLTTEDYFYAFAGFYRNIANITLRKKHEQVLYKYIIQLFHQQQQDYGLSLLASIHVYISWYGSIDQSYELKQFAKQLLFQIENGQLLINNQFQAGLLFPLISHLAGVDFAKKLENILQDHSKPITLQSPKKYNLYCQHLWSYLYITGQFKKEREMLDNVKLANISTFNTSQKIDFFAMMFRAFSFHGLFSEGLSYHDLLFSYSKQMANHETYIFLAMYLIEFYIELGWHTKAKELIDEYSEKDIPLSLKIFTEIHALHYHIETYNTHKALFLLRSIFKRLKTSTSWWNKVMAYYYLIKTVLLLKPHKGIVKIIHKLLNNNQTPFRIQMLSRLALADYHFKTGEFENAKKELMLLSKIAEKSDYIYMMYLADELLIRVYLAQAKYHEAKDIIKKIELSWKDLKNENIPSRISLFKAITALSNGNIDFAHEILITSLEQTDTFGNELLTKEYLSAVKKIKEIMSDVSPVYHEIKRKLDVVTYTITQRHIREIEEIVSLFPVPKNIPSQQAGFDDGSTIYNFEKPTQKIIIDTELSFVSISDSQKKADFSKHEKLFNCLLILAEAFPDYITKEQLFVGIWKIRYSPTIHNNNVHVAIQRLRQQLKQAGLENVIITTQDGYKLSAQYEYRFMKRVQKTGLNQRQLDFLEHQELSLSKEEYAKKYNISLRTAHSDLQELLAIKKIKRLKQGTINYYMVEK